MKNLILQAKEKIKELIRQEFCDEDEEILEELTDEETVFSDIRRINIMGTGIVDDIEVEIAANLEKPSLDFYLYADDVLYRTIPHENLSALIETIERLDFAIFCMMIDADDNWFEEWYGGKVLLTMEELLKHRSGKKT